MSSLSWDGASTVAGLVFSVFCLYLITAVLIMWSPESPSSGTGDTMTASTRRLETAIIANATMLGVAGLLLLARLLSSLGDLLVDLVLALVDPTATPSESKRRPPTPYRLQPPLGFDTVAFDPIPQSDGDPN